MAESHNIYNFVGAKLHIERAEGKGEGKGARERERGREQGRERGRGRWRNKQNAGIQAFTLYACRQDTAGIISKELDINILKI